MTHSIDDATLPSVPSSNLTSVTLLGSYSYCKGLRALTHEPAKAIHGVAAGGEQAAAAHFLLDVPTVLAIPGSDAVHVIDLGVEDLADDRVREECPDGFKQRIPAQHEADK